jgi:hypothetical protein
VRWPPWRGPKRPPILTDREREVLAQVARTRPVATEAKRAAEEARRVLRRMPTGNSFEMSAFPERGDR